MANHRFHKFEKLPDGLTVQDLYDYICANSDDQEPALKYTQPLQEDELNDFRTKFADEAIQLNMEKEEMQEEVRVLKSRIKGIETSMATKLKVIQFKEIEIVEPAFMFKDMPSSSMVYVNSEGIIVYTRDLEDYEMQMSIPLQKAKEVHVKKGKDAEVPRSETFVGPGGSIEDENEQV